MLGSRLFQHKRQIDVHAYLKFRDRQLLRFKSFLLASAAVLQVFSISCGQTVDVYPGQDIQQALDRAAKNSIRQIRVHSGTYQPPRRGQALIWFNARHDGIILEAVGEVILTAANEKLASIDEASFPAVVNHVVYFGDGITGKTVFRGFRITGANHFVDTAARAESIEPHANNDERLRPGRFFYSDGGAIKIFGRSYPTIENVDVVDNFASPCAGGISIEHRGFKEGAVQVRDSRFFRNRAQVTGSAIDLLPGSSAVLENCLFVGNISNTGVDYISPPGHGYLGLHGSGAVTVMKGSSIQIFSCTFTGNWNGVDDRGKGNVYKQSIFWNNILMGGISPKGRYELDILSGAGVTGCFFGGTGIYDLRESVDREGNVFNAPDPKFDETYQPGSAIYKDVGYRPLH